MQEWILPSSATVILLPGDVECPDGSSDVFDTAVPADSAALNPSQPLRLTPEPVSDNHVWYRFAAARPWLSENGSATICWRNDSTKGNALKISQAFWLGPLYARQPMRVSCSQTADCTVWVEGKNFTKMDQSFSRVALLKECGVAQGPGVARMRSMNSGAASFISLVSSSVPDLVTESDLDPGTHCAALHTARVPLSVAYLAPFALMSNLG